MNLHHDNIFDTSGFNDEGAQPSVKSNHDIIFNPPSSASSGRSPLKSVRQPSMTPPKASISHVQASLPPPKATTFETDSPSKRSIISAYAPTLPPHSATPMFSSFTCSSLVDKENRAPSYHSDNVAEFPDPAFGYQTNLKRSFSSVEEFQEDKTKKARCNEVDEVELPDPKSLPNLEDDGNKPQLSYASLIGMAILRSPERKLTLAQIYKWISDSFGHYRRANDSGWQNSIRHNLSLNKAFIKQERPKDDPGKGNYWAIKPGCESQFFHKEKATRRPHSSSSTGHKSSSQPPTSEANPLPALPPLLSKHMPTAKPHVKEPSSDATIPASDAPSSTDDEEKPMPPPASRRAQSSPLQDVRSSPPPMPELRPDTPSTTPELELPSLSRAERQKRKHEDIDDSGYFSSLDSSVPRSYPEPKLPRFDTARQRIRRGRAEEEIARMRSSSHDLSPTRARSFMRQATPSLASSSPLRSLDTALMPPPLTPAINLKPPINRPPSVSPNTNLRIHRNTIRELIGSPTKQLNGDDGLYSPAFKLAEDDLCDFDGDFENGLSAFPDSDHYALCRQGTGSPRKRPAWRTDKARKTTDILADVTGVYQGKSMGSVSKPCDFDSPLRQKSGRSPLHFGYTVNEDSHEDLFGVDFLDTEEPDDIGGLDILQGFSKIGSNKTPSAPAKRPSRPSLGSRSQTSIF